MEKSNVAQPMVPEQVRNLLKFIDATEGEDLKRRVFARLGRECFYCRNLDAWIEQFSPDPQTFLDLVNVRHESKYWEKLEYTADRFVLALTGKTTDGCACAFADCADPPLSLCRHCCTSFQEELFGALFGRKVEVEITESVLLGGEHCNTIIRLV